MGRKLHKSWLILLIATLNLLACLGFGRFSFGAIIPFMKDGLQLTYSQTGIIASSVFLGYMMSATTVGYVVLRYSAKRVILASLLITMAGMMGSGLAVEFWGAYFSCLIIGIGAGGGNVTNLGVVGKWFSQRYRGMALGVVNAGSGIGMVLSGMMVPALMLSDPTNGWRMSWFVLGAATFVFFMLNLLFLKNDPAEVGMLPMGQESKPAATLETHVKEEENALNQTKTTSIYHNKILWMIGFIYLTWGFSYLAFSTFFVDYLIQDVQFSEKSAGQMFAVAGFASILSGFIWGIISDRIGRMPTLFFVYMAQSLLLIAISITSQQGLLLLETILYAVTLWAVPTVMVAAIGDYVAPVKTPVAIGFITLWFGIGQFISPMITGTLVDYTGSYWMGFLLSSGVCFLGSLGCLGLHIRNRKEAATVLQMQ